MKRRTISGLSRCFSSRTLTARSRPRSVSRPLSTAPMPPRAISPRSCNRADRSASAGISGDAGCTTGPGSSCGSVSRNRIAAPTRTSGSSASRTCADLALPVQRPPRGRGPRHLRRRGPRSRRHSAVCHRQYPSSGFAHRLSAPAASVLSRFRSHSTFRFARSAFFLRTFFQ